MTTNKTPVLSIAAIVLALAALAISGAVLLGAGHSSQKVGGTTNYDAQAPSAGFRLVSTATTASPPVSARSSQASTSVRATFKRTAATIAAGSTASLIVEAGTAGVISPLTGVSTNDNVSVEFSTTTPTTYQGLTILGASTSSTPGYITMKVFNGTGAAFTWIASASTTQYHVYR